MKKHRHRILGAVFFVLYLVLLTYFLFFAEEMGRSPDARAEYSYNLTLFKEIRRFILYRDILGWRAVFLNIFGNHFGGRLRIQYILDRSLILVNRRTRLQWLHKVASLRRE